MRKSTHWDEIGLVSPARTASGHRRYGPAEITRLYHALALRRTGLRLERAAALLDEQDPAPAATLRAHLADLDADLARARVLRDRLAGALDALAQVDPDTAERSTANDSKLLMKVIETMTMFGGYVHGYRTAETSACTTRPEH